MIYLVSDIHGCYFSFLNLLKKIDFKDNDILYCIGDVIDRGKYSFELLDYFMQHKNCFLIKGNHELFLELFFNQYLSPKNWWRFGGKQTLNDLQNMNMDNKLKYYNYIHKLPNYTILNEYFLVHSGLNIDLPLVVEDDIIKIKETVDLQISKDIYNYFISNDIHYIPKKYFDKKIIVGHTPTLNFGKANIHYGSNCIDIDCGATYKGGKLGCLRLDDLEEFYVKIENKDLI